MTSPIASSCSTSAGQVAGTPEIRKVQRDRHRLPRPSADDGDERGRAQWSRSRRMTDLQAATSTPTAAASSGIAGEADLHRYGTNRDRPRHRSDRPPRRDRHPAPGPTAPEATTLLALSQQLPLLQGKMTFDGSVTTARCTARRRRADVRHRGVRVHGLVVHDDLVVAGCEPEQALVLLPSWNAACRSASACWSAAAADAHPSQALGTTAHTSLATRLSIGLAPLVVERLLRMQQQATDRAGVLVEHVSRLKLRQPGLRPCATARSSCPHTTSPAAPRPHQPNTSQHTHDHDHQTTSRATKPHQ